MKKSITILTATLLLVGQVSFAQDANYSQQLINQVESIKQSVSVSSKQEKLHKHCLTAYLSEAKKNWEKLTPAAKDYFKVLMVRPTLTGPEVVFYSTYFDIHYTLSGDDAVDPTDNDANGYPDYIEQLAQIADYVYQTDSARGFTEPPADGAGGSDYYDIYLLGPNNSDMSGAYGFVAPENNIGDNPKSTTITEIYASTSWMALRSDEYVSLGGIDGLKVTAAHEISHSFDMGYNANLSFFFMEAKGPWEEQLIYPTNPDNFQYLMEIFGTPDVAMNWDKVIDGSGYDLHMYGAWIFNKYLTERTNDNIIRKILERCIACNNDYACEITGYNNELTANWSSDFETIFGNWLIANVVMDNDPGYTPYIYSNANAYGNYIDSSGGLNIEDVITYTGTTVNWDSDIDGNERLQRLSGDYLEINPNQNFSLTFTPNNPIAELDLVLLKVNSTSGTLTVQPSVVSGNNLIINVTDQANYDGFVAIIGRLDADVADTLSEQYTLTIDGVTGVPNVSNIEKISIYPNPVKDKLILSGLSDKENFTFEIKDVLGKKVYSSVSIVEHERFIADVTDLDNGVYFLTLTDSNKKSKTHKVIISK
ncbi:MAG: T9SS type A sorting domain-containing protein [Bacteroidetes bacterium]|nr:T9SS type A sorting domain-containing protein [Bacteroidota bacterium]